MRFHIRHSIDMTIYCMTFYTRVNSAVTRRTLTDLSEGGLCFRSHVPFDVGSQVHMRIPVRQPAYETSGTVAWCAGKTAGYQVGVVFDETPVELLSVVGRACEIKHYNRLQRDNGRLLTTDQAAREWLSATTPTFPGKVA